MLAKLTNPIICSNPECRCEIRRVMPRKFGIVHKTKCPDCRKVHTYKL